MPKPLSPEELAGIKDEITQMVSDPQSLQQLKTHNPEFKNKLLTHFKPLVEEETKITEESFQKRTLYADIELYRLDWNNLIFNEKLESLQGKLKPLKNKELNELLESSEAYKLSIEVYTIFDQYRKDLRIHRVETSFFRRALHFVSFIVYTFLVVNVCLFSAPLQLLDPILRKQGWKTHELPVDRMHIFFTSSVLYWSGGEVFWEGLENMDRETSYIQMYSHASSFDGFTLCTSGLPIRLFGKKSLFLIPFLGWLGYFWNHPVINRNNLESAKKSMSSALSKLVATGRSLSVSPEGTRSRVGRLVDFKKGAFHLAVDAQKIGKIPILPVLLMNPGSFWAGDQWAPAPGRIYARCLKPIEVKEGENYKQLRERVHRLFLEEYKKPIGKTVPKNYDVINFFALPFCALFVKYFYGWLFGVIGSLF